MTAGLSLVASPSIEGSKLTHQTSSDNHDDDNEIETIFPARIPAHFGPPSELPSMKELAPSKEHRSLMTDLIYAPGPTSGTVLSPKGEVLTPPAGWVLVPPGDAALTRRIKAAGPHWPMQEKKGRKIFSHGIWTDGATVEALRANLEAERSTESFAKKKGADAARREKAQAEYVEDFYGSVLTFLNFHQTHAQLAGRFAEAVTTHATPVGSGTVARTERIPIEERAEAAVIAWMRHQTTGYDDMVIARIKGKRREVRRELAQRSKQLLSRYRRGETQDPECPLRKALA